MIDASQRLPFPKDYFDARARFRELAAARGWRTEATCVCASGPDGNALTIDVAISPGADDLPTLVLTSGLHGVEGFFGSAVQAAVLRDWHGEDSTAAPMRVVLIHALNPYGFAFRRRTDENNVDLNRNFLRPEEPYRGSSPVYRRLDPFLNPKGPPPLFEPFGLLAAVIVARYGLKRLKQAIAEGQYDFPQGLFYGGQEPAPLQNLLAERLPVWLSETNRVVHLDLHTGLGPSGRCKLLIDSPLSPEQDRRLRAACPNGLVERLETGQTAYAIRGGFGAWCVRNNADRDYVYANAEFGTYAPVTMLRGLRAENRAFPRSGPGDPRRERSQHRMQELFCPSSTAWRATVHSQCVTILTRAWKMTVMNVSAKRY